MVEASDPFAPGRCQGAPQGEKHHGIMPSNEPVGPPDTILAPSLIANAVYEAIRQCAVTLRPDYAAALAQAAEAGPADSRAARIMGQMLENARIGAEDAVPICQDTGTVWVCLEAGRDVMVPGNIFSLVDDAVGRAYRDGLLRMSVVRDALLDRTNTESNAPAFCELQLTEGQGATLHVMLKGGGSDNASRVVMLPPGSGRAGVMDAVLDCVRDKGANACPPLVIGVGVGSTFDHVASLAKHALLRPVGQPGRTAQAAFFEDELLEQVNGLGLGPGALGGFPTALAVHVETAPCHIAALPVAVNLGCCALRSRSIPLTEGAAHERP